MKVYKVVEKFEGKYYSAIIALHARPFPGGLEGYDDASVKNWGKWNVAYRKNKVAYPKVKGSFLFSFRRLKDAKEFLFYNNHQRELIVFEAETVGKIREFPIIACVYEDTISEFWKTAFPKCCGLTSRLHQTPPDGTIGAEGIKLIEKKIFKQKPYHV
jgi:hypothetical protein